MWIFICFNFAVVFLSTWMYLGGGRKIKTLFGGKNKNEDHGKQNKGDKA